MFDDSWEGELTVPDEHHQEVVIRVVEFETGKLWVWDEDGELVPMNQSAAYILGLRIPAEIYPVGAKIRVTLDYERP